MLVPLIQTLLHLRVFGLASPALFPHMPYFHPSFQTFDGSVILNRCLLQPLKQPLMMLHGHLNSLPLCVLIKHSILGPTPRVHVLHRNHPIRLRRIDAILNIVINHIEIILPIHTLSLHIR